MGGMFIETDQLLPYGHLFTALVELPALEGPARIPCTVRWTCPSGMGVLFGTLRASEAWAINRLSDVAQNP